MGIGSPEWTWAGLGGDVASSEEGEIDRGEGIELFAQAARVPRVQYGAIQCLCARV